MKSFFNKKNKYQNIRSLIIVNANHNEKDFGKFEDKIKQVRGNAVDNNQEVNIRLAFSFSQSEFKAILADSY